MKKTHIEHLTWLYNRMVLVHNEKENVDYMVKFSDIINELNGNTSPKPIDNVTTDRLDLALRMVGITFDHKTIDKIIDLVELIEEKGGETSISDIDKLKSEWKFSFEESGNQCKF